MAVKAPVTLIIFMTERRPAKMPRVRRIVEAGLVREVKDMFTGRIHTPGVTRRPRGEIGAVIMACCLPYIRQPKGAAAGFATTKG